MIFMSVESQYATSY